MAHPSGGEKIAAYSRWPGTVQLRRVAADQFWAMVGDVLRPHPRREARASANVARGAGQRMNAHFVTRQACPGCGAGGAQTIFQRPYDEPRLRAALENFYAEVGRLDYAELLGATFVVQACPG